MQSCGLVIVLFLILNFAGSRTLRLRSEKTFRAFLHAVFLNLLLDIVTNVLLSSGCNPAAGWMVDLCQLYLVSQPVMLCAYFCYATLDIRPTRKAHWRVVGVVIAVTVLLAVLIWILPLSVAVENGGRSLSGAAAVAALFFFAVALLVTLGFTIHLR